MTRGMINYGVETSSSQQRRSWVEKEEIWHKISAHLYRISSEALESKTTKLKSLPQFMWQLKTCPVTYHHRIEETEVILHQFLILVLYKGEWFDSHFERYIPEQTARDRRLKGSKWRGGEENILAPAWKGTSVILVVARHIHTPVLIYSTDISYAVVR